MVQIQNKVEWCLKKAQKELEKGELHRGLVKNFLSPTVARKHLEKAQHNLSAANFFQKQGYSDWSASAFFYCAYHCFLAILRKYGYESRNQECTLATIEMLREEGHIKIDPQFIDMLNLAKRSEIDYSIIQIREEFQYGTEREYKDEKEFFALVDICKKLIDETMKIIE